MVPAGHIHIMQIYQNIEEGTPNVLFLSIGMYFAFSARTDSFVMFRPIKIDIELEKQFECA